MFLLSLLLFLMQSVLPAATFHVRSGGMDGEGRNGSQSQPWATLAYAIEKTESGTGNTVKLGPGVFSESGTIKVPVGVSIVGAGVDSTTLTLSSGIGPILRFLSYDRTEGDQTVRDLRFDGKNRTIETAIKNDKRHNFTVVGCAFDRFAKEALHIQGDRDHGWKYLPQESDFVTGIEIADVTFTDCGKGDAYNGGCGGMLLIGFTKDAVIRDVTMTNQTSYAYGIKFSTACAGYNYGLRIHDCTFDIDGKFDIELFNAYNGCEIYNCTLEEISMGGNKVDPGPELDIRIHHNDIIRSYNHTCIELQMADVQVDHNYIVNGGIGIWSAGGTLEHPDGAVYEVRRNYRIHNNVFTSTPEYRDEVHSINIFRTSAVSGDPGPFEIYNNTFYNVKRAVTIGMETENWANKACDIQIKNNIIKNAVSGLCYWIKGHADNAVEDVDMRYNLFENVTKEVVAFGGSISNFTNSDNLVGALGLHETGTKTSPFFEIADAGSPAYDAGVDVGLPFVGEAPDIGAFEFGREDVVVGRGEFSEPGYVNLRHSGPRRYCTGNEKPLSAMPSSTRFYNLRGRSVAPTMTRTGVSTAGSSNGILIRAARDSDARRLLLLNDR